MFGATALKAFVIGAAVTALPLIGSVASAATVDLTTGGNITGDGATTGTFSSGGITGTVAAGCGYAGYDTNCDHVGPFSDPKIQTTLLGTGVSSFLDISNQLDTTNNGEFLTFTFDTVVNLLSIDFGAFAGKDAYDLLINGVLYASGSSTDPWVTEIDNVTSFSVAAVGMGKILDPGFTLTSFTAVAVPVAPVPLPAAGLLMLGGLGALGAAKRRRTQAA